MDQEESGSHAHPQRGDHQHRSAGHRGGGGGHRGGGGKRHQHPRSNKEWKLIEKLLDKALNDQSKARRWGVFFKSLTFVYLFVILLSFWNVSHESGVSVSESHVGVVDLKGMIAEPEVANADALATALRRAFEAKASKAVLLKVNSPGGSPVQSGMIYDEIVRLRAKYPEKKLYAVITDVGASGAYYVSAAADEIYADKASLVGSIGVISMGFGFEQIMEKVGVERRVYTSGENKAMLDPFLPLKEKDVEHFSEVLGYVHRQFIDQVRKGRGDRLTEQDVFNGLVWSGEQALALGLIDGLGSPGQVARDIIGEEHIVSYTQKPNPIESLARKIGTSFSGAVLQSLSQYDWR